MIQSGPLPTVQDFHTAFDAGEPDFASGAVSDTTIMRWIAYAVRFVAFDVWIDLYSDGVLLLAAHEACLEAWQATKGGGLAVAREYESKSVGGVSTGRGQGIAREALDRFQRTTYGQKYAQLRRMVGMSGIVTGSPCMMPLGGGGAFG